MDVQQMLDIAMRHATTMSDAMIVACFQRAHELGQSLAVPYRTSRVVVTQAVSAIEHARVALDAGEYERMVLGNSDTRRNHC